MVIVPLTGAREPIPLKAGVKESLVSSVVNVRNVYGPAHRESKIVFLVWIGFSRRIWIHTRRVEIVITENFERISVKSVGARCKLVLGNTLSQPVLRGEDRIQNAELAD